MQKNTPLKLSESIVINSTPEKVFDLTQNYERRLQWDTFLSKAQLIDAKQADIGVKAWCVSKHGLGMETEYVSFNRPKVTAIKQTKRSLLFDRFAGSWTFEPNDQVVKVTFTYSYQLNFPFGLFSKFVHQILGKNVQQRLRDLKSVAENSTTT